MAGREGGEREDHGGPLLFRRIFREVRADPAQCKELERDGLRGARTFERLAEALVRLGDVSERERVACSAGSPTDAKRSFASVCSRSASP